MFHGCMETVSHAWGVTHTRVSPLSRPQTTKAVGQNFVGSETNQSIPMEVFDVIQGASCHGSIVTHSTCYRCMDKFWQPWNTINTLGCLSSKQHNTQTVGPDSVKSVKPPCHPHGGVCCYMKRYDIEVLPPILHVLLAHVQGLTSLWHNQYADMPSIQATEYPSCVTRFGRICKIIIPLSWWCVLLPEHPFHISCLYMEKVREAWGTINELSSCQTKPHINQSVGLDLAGSAKQPCHTQGGVYR